MTQLSKNASMVSSQFKNHIHCNEYLVDGVLHTWNGATSEVYSTIHSEGKDGQVAIWKDIKAKQENRLVLKTDDEI